MAHGRGGSDRLIMPRVPSRDIIVIGGSAGALAPLREIVRQLPSTLPVALFVVVHTAPDSRGVLAQILDKASPLTAELATDGDAIRGGRIYVAPPDHHLLVESGYMRVTRGPRENGFRPAVDPLFRTAAAAYGSRVVGIILSGAQDDGVLGLRHIKERDGLAIVQDPAEADTPSMPESAMRQVAVDHVLTAADIGSAIARLAQVPAGRETRTVKDTAPDIAEEGVPHAARFTPSGPPSPFTCPDCGGSLWELRDGNLVRYECRVGHGFNVQSLVAAHADGLETALWSAVRALEESAALRHRMAEHARERGMTAIADRYAEHAAEAEARAQSVRRILVAEGRADRPAGSPEPENVGDKK